MLDYVRLLSGERGGHACHFSGDNLDQDLDNYEQDYDHSWWWTLLWRFWEKGHHGIG